MRSLSSVDIHYLVSELAPLLEGGRIRKVYTQGDETHLRIYKRGVGEGLLVAGPEVFYYTFSGIEHDQEPTPFSMFLRKRLKNQEVTRLAQLGFERIVLLETPEYKLYLELFGGANVVLADKEDTIIIVREGREWSSRILRKGVKYVPPPQGLDPRNLSLEDFATRLSSSDKKIVALLARELGLGGVYAEEALARAGIDKNKPARELSPGETERLWESVRSLLSARPDPVIIKTEDSLEPFPFPMESAEGEIAAREEKYFLAVAGCALSTPQKEREPAAPKKEKKSRLEARLETQQEKLLELERAQEEARQKGDAIYLHYNEIEEKLSELREKTEKEGWSAVAETPPSGVLSVDPKKKTAVMVLDGLELELFVTESPQRSADHYYSLAKQYKEKIERLERAIEETKREMEREREELEKNAKREEDRGEVKREKKKWYHNYRWFVSSEGFLCVCARDAATNEELIKKRMEKTDIVFHAEIGGSPFLLVKAGGKKVGEATLSEAAQFVASHSRAWREGLGSIEVFWVRPEQVSKKPPSGEYISKGSFMIYGKKNIMRTELALGVGIVDGEVRAWPPGAISSRTRKFVVVRPGDTPARDLAGEIVDKLSGIATMKEKELLKRKKGDVAGLIPFGKGSLG